MPTALIVLLVIVVAIVVLVATRPNTFRLERSIVVDAPPDHVYPLVNDLHRWSEWSPWDEKDPNMTLTYEGPESGPGAARAWAGDKNVGEGRMEISDSTPPSHVVIALHFLKPFEGHNTAEFAFHPVEGGGTRVTWSMHGPLNAFTKLMGLVMPMDKMIGPDFERGLAKLKALAER